MVTLYTVLFDQRLAVDNSAHDSSIVWGRTNKGDHRYKSIADCDLKYWFSQLCFFLVINLYAITRNMKKKQMLIYRLFLFFQSREWNLAVTCLFFIWILKSQRGFNRYAPLLKSNDNRKKDYRNLFYKLNILPSGVRQF